MRLSRVPAVRILITGIGTVCASRLSHLGLGLLLIALASTYCPVALADRTVPPTQGTASADHLWVDAVDGDDGNDGRTAASAFRTIQKAADLAGPGTTVHILPGVYRETVDPEEDGSATEPILYVAEEGPDTAILRGSEPASSLTWTRLTADTIGLPPGVDPTDIYYADLSAWDLDHPPRFVVELNSRGVVDTRLPLAREPDWQVGTDWKYHEFWWAADGGSGVAGCDPTTDDDSDCDAPWRSATKLTDRNDDAEPAGIEPGNLTTLDDLTGGTLVALDANRGHYAYRRDIVAHDVSAGRITVDEVRSSDYGLGWGTKYYVEGRPCLLDTPGEWWYDDDSGRLYLWPPTPGNPATMDIEISRWNKGFNLRNRSYTIIDGLTVELFNGDALYQYNYNVQKSYGNTVRNVTLRYANRGVYVEQVTRSDTPADSVTDGFTLEDSEIAYMDTYAILLTDWWENSADPDDFRRPGIRNTVIRNNELHHLGFRSDDDNAVGSVFRYANKLRFEGNHVHHVAHNGVQFSRSLIQSSKQYGFTPDEIKIGEILIKDNVFERACQLTTDCGALKFWGDPPDTHVFRDVLITANVFRDTFGWTYVAEKRGHWAGGVESDVQGMGGFGLYVDNASGIHVYRNTAYNNAYAGFAFSGVWRDGDIVYYNNVAANSLDGFHLGGLSYDTHGCVNTQVVNNILVNSERYGIRMNDDDGRYDNILIDHNLYYNNGWRQSEAGGAMYIYRGGSVASEYYPTLADIQAGTDWENHGVEGSAGFEEYDVADHDLHDGSWPDFHLTAASVNAVNRGTAELPASLTALLEAFDVDDPRWGTAFDIGAFEYEGFTLSPNPPARAIDPGEVATYVIELGPSSGFTATVSLVAASPSPSLTLHLAPTAIVPPGQATLTVTDTHTGTVLPGLWYAVPITGTGAGFTRVVSVRLLVGGARMYVPLALKNY